MITRADHLSLKRQDPCLGPRMCAYVSVHVCAGGDKPLLMRWGPFILETEKLQAEGG